MNNFLLVFSLVFSFFMLSSCSDDDSGIEIQVLSPEENQSFNAGESFTIEVIGTDDTGIAKITITESTLGLDVTEEYSTSSISQSISTQISIPSDANINDTYEILITINDIEDNSEQEYLNIAIQ